MSINVFKGGESYTERSLVRVEGYFEVDKENLTRPADIIADLMHYCREQKIDFDAEMSQAVYYVADEQEMDEYDTQRNSSNKP